MNLADELASLFHGAVRRMGRELAEETGRPLNQIRALTVIARGGIGTQSALGERLHIDPAATSRLVDKLEEDGLLRRLKGNDRRCIRLELTRKADRLLAAVSEGMERTDAELRGYLTQTEAAALEQILAKLNGALARRQAARGEAAAAATGR